MAKSSQQKATGNAKKRVTFKLHAPGVKSVFLAGSFNDWDATGRPMKQDKKGRTIAWCMFDPGSG